MSSQRKIFSEESKLCLPCGLCCQGILFPYAELQSHELELAGQLRLCVDRNSEKYHFYLPCLHYLKGRCSIYHHQRPGVCAGFRCQLLRRFSDGIISYEEALHIVQNVNDVVASIYHRGSGMFVSSRSLSGQIRQIMERQADDAAFRRAHAALLLELAKLHFLFHQYFYAPDTEESETPALATA